MPLSPTADNIPQVSQHGRYELKVFFVLVYKNMSDGLITNFIDAFQERQSGGDPVANGQPLELLLLNVDDTENNNHMVLNKNHAHNQHNGHNENEELTATKDNLKSFIERWEEHPNSPYVFDTDANRISPVTVCGLADAAHPKRLNGGSANSGLSSRGKIYLIMISYYYKLNHKKISNYDGSHKRENL